MTDLNVDLLVTKFVELRDRRTALKKQYEAEDGKLIELMDKIEAKFAELLDATGSNSFATDHGTVFRAYKESARVADWNALLDYIREEDEWSLLERRVSKAYVKELMEEQRDGSYRNNPPPGVDFTRIASVQVRRKS